MSASRYTATVRSAQRLHENSDARASPRAAIVSRAGAIAEQRFERAGPAVHVGRDDEASGVARDLAQHGDVARDHRGALRHRLEHGEPEALVQAREREHVGARVERGEVGTPDRARETHPVAERALG